MDSDDPLFVLYTSGSTGTPRGLVHSCAGYFVFAVVTSAFAFDLRPGDVFASVVDVGFELFDACFFLIKAVGFVVIHTLSMALLVLAARRYYFKALQCTQTHHGTGIYVRDIVLPSFILLQLVRFNFLHQLLKKHSAL